MLKRRHEANRRPLRYGVLVEIGRLLRFYAPAYGEYAEPPAVFIREARSWTELFMELDPPMRAMIQSLRTSRVNLRKQTKENCDLILGEKGYNFSRRKRVEQIELYGGRYEVVETVRGILRKERDQANET